MAKADFDRFVERQTQAAPRRDFDPSQLLTEWLASLDALYREIEGYLAEYERRQKVKTIYSITNINEETLGIYEARRLLISIGKQEILLTPVARFVIGSQGRVDIEGSAGRSRLLRVPESATGRFRFRLGTHRAELQDEPVVWKLATLPPEVSLFPLSQDAFLTMLVEISNG